MFNIKEILLDDEARKAQLDGARLVAYAVGKTLGPRGSNAGIERTYGVPMTIHDGVKVLSQICGDNNFLENQWENIGAKNIYTAAKESNDYAGDGSTGAAVLTYSILAEGHKLVSAGHNSRMLRRGILAAADAMDKELTKLASPITSDKQKKQIATISAQDERIGESIAAAINLVGDKGIVTVDELGSDLSIDCKEGMHFDSGLIDNIWVTSAIRQESELENPVILVSDHTISEVAQFESMLERIVGGHKKGNMLILAKDISGSALMFLAQNKSQNGLNLVPVKAPLVDQEEYLRDIALLTGAKFISQSAGDDINDVELGDLGTADKVIVGKQSTVIIGGQGAKEDIDSRLEYIDNQLDRPDIDQYKKERLLERKSKMTSGIAIIHVGGDAERREQVLDAISATKAAIDEGIVPGGETALLRARTVLDDVKKNLTTEEAFGVDIVYEAVEEPFRLLIRNSGEDDGAVLNKVLEGTNGYNVVTREYTDLIKDGVIDPVKVTRSILRQATKHASSMLTTELLITNKRRKDDTPRNGQ